MRIATQGRKVLILQHGTAGYIDLTMYQKDPNPHKTADHLIGSIRTRAIKHGLLVNPSYHSVRFFPAINIH